MASDASFASTLALAVEQDNVGAIQAISTSVLESQGAETFATDTAVKMQFRAALLRAIRLGSIRSVRYMMEHLFRFVKTADGQLRYADPTILPHVYADQLTLINFAYTEAIEAGYLEAINILVCQLRLFPKDSRRPGVVTFGHPSSLIALCTSSVGPDERLDLFRQIFAALFSVPELFVPAVVAADALATESIQSSNWDQLLVSIEVLPRTRPLYLLSWVHRRQVRPPDDGIMWALLTACENAGQELFDVLKVTELTPGKRYMELLENFLIRNGTLFGRGGVWRRLKMTSRLPALRLWYANNSGT
jgi:hypothetical protein